MWEKIVEVCEVLLIMFAFILLLSWFDEVRAADTPAMMKVYAAKMELKYKLPEGLLSAVCEQESDWRNVLGANGEVGVCQIKPATALTVCYKCKELEKVLRNPRTNIMMAAIYLAWIRDNVSPDPSIMLAAYNAGPSSPIVRYMVKVQARITEAHAGAM